MTYIFTIVTLSLIIQSFLIIRKEPMWINTYLAIGVLFPCVLYLLNWSNLISEKPTFFFYYIFITFFVIVMLARKFCVKVREIQLNYVLIKNYYYFDFVNLFFIFCFFVECYLLSGSIIPALRGIDIHTKSYPIISYITSAIYPILFCDILMFIKKREKRFLFWSALLVLIPFICKGTRFQVLMSLLSCLSFYIFYCLHNKSDIKTQLMNIFKNQIGKRNKNKTLFVMAIFVVLVIIMGKYTEYRMNHFGLYNISYAETIRYSGPKISDGIDDLIAIYYGYFALSFNNLNLNIANRTVSHNYLGLYSYKSIYYGVLQLDNIFGLNPYYPETNRFITSRSATVSTAFFDYYYDYGYLCFIPVLLYVALCVYVRNKMYKKQTLFWTGLYFYLIPLLFFTSFQNVIYKSTLIWDIIILYLLVKVFFKNKHYN